MYNIKQFSLFQHMEKYEKTTRHCDGNKKHANISQQTTGLGLGCEKQMFFHVTTFVVLLHIF